MSFPGNANSNVFGHDWIVMADAGGEVPPLSSFAHVAKAVRDLLLGAWPTSPPEIISGHSEDGMLSKVPHLAVLPLAVVGRPVADGRLMGLALCFPAVNAPIPSPRDRVSILATAREILSPPANTVALTFGAKGVWHVEVRPGHFGFALDPARYLQPSQAWASVTPVIFDKFPKGAKLSRAEIIAAACQNIGLPRPTSVQLESRSAIAGAPPALNLSGDSNEWSFPSRRDGSRHPFERLLMTHVTVCFSEPVAGPVILGRGRFQGLGLCLPPPIP